MNYIEKIENSISKVKNNDFYFSRFFNELEKYDVIIIGGFIRDVLNDEKIRDIDIILNEEDLNIIDGIIKKYNLSFIKNRFDGYKIIFSDFTVDIWYISNHSLFKKGIYKQEFANIKDTTFINYDSLVYDLKSKELDITYYLECINNNRISFVGTKEAIDNNDSVFLSIVKILEISLNKGFDISDEVYKYILKYYESNKECFIYKLKEEYKKHYGYDLSQQLEEYIKDYINKNNYVKIKK